MFDPFKVLARLKSRRFVSIFTITIAMFVAGVAAFSQPTPASAHCDSVNGPVVAAAQKALDTGESKWVLAYVQPDAEPELVAAFEKTLAVRKSSPDAQALADRWFFETTVRLHRTGEGATYTGLKEGGDYGPALESAEKALETNSIADVQALLNQALVEGIDKQYQQVVKAREKAAQEATVEALREQAEAELIFEKYVDALYKAALGNAAPAEGGTSASTVTPAGHAH